MNSDDEAGNDPASASNNERPQQQQQTSAISPITLTGTYDVIQGTLTISLAPLLENLKKFQCLPGADSASVSLAEMLSEIRQDLRCIEIEGGDGDAAQAFYQRLIQEVPWICDKVIVETTELGIQIFFRSSGGIFDFNRHLAGGGEFECPLTVAVRNNGSQRQQNVNQLTPLSNRECGDLWRALEAVSKSSGLLWHPDYPEWDFDPFLES